MKAKKYPILLATLGLFFLSCEKKIDVDLDSIPPRLVVDGVVKDGMNRFQVQLSMTANFFDVNEFPAVNGASVTIRDQDGNTFPLTQDGDGLYQSEEEDGVPGNTYSIEVVSEGETYAASNTMVEPVAIDSVTYEWFDDEDFVFLEEEDFGYYVTVHHPDEGGVANYYQYRVFLNGEPFEPRQNKELTDDEFFDGNQVEQFMFDQFFIGDTVRVELWSLDEQSFYYFKTLNEVADNNGGGNGAVPQNPEGNLTNGALGYFGAYAVRSSAEVVIEEL